MRDLYSVLRVATKASDAEIKSAFRRLAKTCHPDLKPGDRQAEEAFQEVRRAYKFLSNPETRKIYDTFLAERRAQARRRFKRAAATMSASFVITTATAFLAVVWLQGGGFGGGRELPEGSSGTVEIARAPTAAQVEEEKTGAGLPKATEKRGLREAPTGP